MKNSSMCVLVAPYGVACAWEAGWFSAVGRPVVLISDLSPNQDPNWMIRNAVSERIGNIQELPRMFFCERGVK